MIDFILAFILGVWLGVFTTLFVLSIHEMNNDL